MWNGLKGLFSSGPKTSRDQAKGRLHLVLAQDRSGLDGAKLQDMRREVAEVIAKYVDIDLDGVEIQVESLSREMTQLKVSSPLPPRNTLGAESTG